MHFHVPFLSPHSNQLGGLPLELTLGVASTEVCVASIQASQGNNTTLSELLSYIISEFAYTIYI